MSAARSVLWQKDIAGFDDLPCASTALELESPAQGDHILAMRSVVPVEAGACGSLFEGDSLSQFVLGYGVERFGLVPFDLANRKMRLVIIAGEDADEPDRHAHLILVRSIEPLAA